MKISEFQEEIRRTYFDKDSARGTAATFMWFVEEVGELSKALARGTDRANLEEEFADVFAWLASLASIAGVDLEAAAVARYGEGCPYCETSPCACDGKETRAGL